MTVERIFIIGGTGNIGKTLVEELISKNVKLSLYARNPAKVTTLFPTGDITIVEGDLNNLDGLKDAVKGHTRLFFIVGDFALNMEHVKKTVATYAFEAGVKQVVDISSITVSYSWRTTYIGEAHAQAERAVYKIPNRGRYVAIRPGRFMSNMTTFDRINPDGVIRDIYDPEGYLGWISPNDIASVAAAVLTEDVEKHQDAVYELVGDRVTPNQRAEMLSRVLDKKISYQQIPAVERYNHLISLHLPHSVAFNLTCHPASAPAEGVVTNCIPILTGKEPESLEEYSIKNKALL